MTIYQSKLDVYNTQIAIKKIKDFFENELASSLNLVRVSAPLFVPTNSGLNDELGGNEKPISFDTKTGSLEIVQSLAKWKRMALFKYNFKEKEGLYTDMNAIRKAEVLDCKHSYYVDQWDWEKIITSKDRNLGYFKEIVDVIYEVLKATDNYISCEYPVLRSKLPNKITYISSQELEDEYPDLDSSTREYEIVKQYKAVCLTQIGKTLTSGQKHERRAPDYDDWELNGDILVYNEVIDDVFELSSMGIRVDKNSLIIQLKKANQVEKMTLEYHKAIIEEKLPLTIGGGIGQSRLCMFFLEKSHIGEVQASSWSEEIIRECNKKGIKLL